MDEAALQQAVDALFAILHERQIEYALVGGIALLQYVAGRNTEDIDLIVAVNALQHLPEVQIDEQNEYFAQGKLGALTIDFLLTRNRSFDEIRRSRTVVLNYAGRPVHTATVEGLLLLKLYVLPSLYRQGDFVRVGLYENDIATLLQAYHPTLAAFLDPLQTYLSAADFATVQEIMGEIEARIARFDRRADA